MTFRKVLQASAVAALLLPAGVAFANGGGTHRSWHSHDRGQDHARKGETKGGLLRAIPEFDPAAVGAVAAFLAGGGLLLARRRTR